MSYYPDGAELDPRAPYNRPENKPDEIEKIYFCQYCGREETTHFVCDCGRSEVVEIEKEVYHEPESMEDL